MVRMPYDFSLSRLVAEDGVRVLYGLLLVAAGVVALSVFFLLRESLGPTAAGVLAPIAFLLLALLARV